MAPEAESGLSRKRTQSSSWSGGWGSTPIIAGQQVIRYLPGKEKVVSELTKLAANSDVIYLATDLDREGEAIAWHLKEAIGGDPSRYQRVVFNEITKKAVTEAFEVPVEA